MRGLALLALLAACATARGPTGHEIEDALRSSGDTLATLQSNDRIYYLGMRAIAPERRALRDALAAAPRDAAAARAGPWSVGPDDVVGFRYPDQSLSFGSAVGLVRVRRVPTAAGYRYWIAADGERATTYVGPRAGAAVDRAWEALFRAAARAAGVPRDMPGFIAGFGLRDILIDLRGFNEDR